MRQNFGDGFEVVFEDYNKLSSRLERQLYDRVLFELIQRAEDSFFGDSFLVSFASPTSVSVNAGNGFQTDATVDGAEPTKRLLYRGANATVNLTAPDSVNDRIDLICARHARVLSGDESRNFKAASDGTISVENLQTISDWEAEIITVDGTPAGSPVAPAVPAGYIQIAELDVSAVSGLAGAGAITDSRNLMPLGASSTINTLAFQRLTQSAGLTLQQANEELDALAVNGLLTTNTFSDSVSDPAAPAAGSLVIYNKAGLLFTRDNAGVVSPLSGGGGGGGAGAKWLGDALEQLEYAQDVKLFEQNGAEKETLYIKVPDSYLAGRQIQALLGFYSPSNSDEWNFQIVTTLIRKGQDAITSVANQNTADSGDITNDQADEFREVVIDLSSATGQINSFSVSPGDLLKLELTRIAPAGTEDSADLRFVPNATEIKFG